MQPGCGDTDVDIILFPHVDAQYLQFSVLEERNSCVGSPCLVLALPWQRVSPWAALPLQPGTSQGLDPAAPLLPAWGELGLEAGLDPVPLGHSGLWLAARAALAQLPALPAAAGLHRRHSLASCPWKWGYEVVFYFHCTMRTR